MAGCKNDIYKRCKDGIYKRGASYYVQIKVNGRRIRKSLGPDKRAAELVLSEMKRQRALARVTQNFSGFDKLLTPKSTKTFSEAYQSYITERQLKPSSRLAYEDRSRHLLTEFGGTAISRISEEEIARFQTRLTKTLSPRRVNAIVNLLRCVLDTCTRRGLIERNPSAGVDRIEEQAAEIDPLTREELDAAIAQISTTYRPLFICLAWTGARPSEMKALTWGDVDFVRNEIRISKGRYKSHEQAPKTKSSNRIITMLPPVREQLLALSKSMAVDISGAAANQHVFVGKSGEPINRGLDRIWAIALSRAGLRHRPQYQLRHTFASLTLQAGQDPGWVAKMLGHSNLQTTFRHYMRYIPGSQEKDLRISKALFDRAAS